MQRKAVKYLDGRIELEITDEEAKLLLGLSKDDIKQAVIAVAQSTKETEHSAHADKKLRLKHKFPPEEWQLVSQTEGARRGSTEHNLFLLYQSRKSGGLVGIEKSKKKEKVWYLNTPNNPSGHIAIIKRAVESLPFQEPFSRRTLAETLPASLSRPEILKFALEYFKYIGIVKDHIGKEMGTGAKLYQRIQEKGDSPRQESVQDAAEAIPR